MGVITITISKARKPQIKPRTHDKASTLATLYADLFDRLERAAKDLTGKTKDDFNPEDHPHAPAGQANGGQFVKGAGGGPVGEKPTTVKAKAGKPAMHELFSSGHPFSKHELMSIAGIKTDKLFSDYIAMLKNPKYAGAAGALKIQKLANGGYQVVLPDGTPAPPPPAMPDITKHTAPKVAPAATKMPLPISTPAITVPATPMSKGEADTKYAFHTELAQDKCAKAIGDAPDKAAIDHALLQFKTDKNAAMAQWATNTTGTLKQPVPQQLFKADDKLGEDLLGAALAGADDLIPVAFQNWKKNTQLEKQGQFPPTAPPPAKPDTKTLAAATKHWAESVKNEPPPQPVPYEHLIPKDFKHISAEDFTAPGTKSFQHQIIALQNDLEQASTGGNVGNKKLVEQTLQKHLKDKKHYQALRDWYNKEGAFNSESLERRLIGSWASSSGDHNALSCAMQVATQDAFAQPKDSVTYEQLHSVKSGQDDQLMKDAAQGLGLKLNTAEDAKAFRQGLQEFIHGQYENTQEKLKDMGIQHVMVARGMTIVPPAENFSGKPANVKLQPASSFSANYATANVFAGGHGTVYLCKIPVSQVLGTYLTGFGCTSEHELVVLGHDTIKSFPVKKSDAQSLAGATSAIKDRIANAKA